MVMQNRILAAIAQLVEQGTENPCVLGSIPSCGTIKKRHQFGCLFYCIFLSRFDYDRWCDFFGQSAL